jgi:UDP-N-acetylmuramoyl-L-alanyl-D-glutamate--2,6-diaminopimelate ligase
MLTNISQDHLDLHGTMDHYVRTKARIFKPEKNKVCILPKDCEYFDIFFETAKGGQVLTYSTQTDADYQALHIASTENGMSLTVKEQNTEHTITSQLSGMFNAENLLGAYALLRTIGIDASILQKAWTDFTGAPGRMEPVLNTL